MTWIFYKHQYVHNKFIVMSLLGQQIWHCMVMFVFVCVCIISVFAFVCAHANVCMQRFRIRLDSGNDFPICILKSAHLISGSSMFDAMWHPVCFISSNSVKAFHLISSLNSPPLHPTRFDDYTPFGRHFLAAVFTTRFLIDFNRNPFSLFLVFRFSLIGSLFSPFPQKITLGNLNFTD